jgi:hypothetical protein
MLSDEQGARDHLARERGDIVVAVEVAVAGDHVGDVDPPAVEPRVEPAAEDRPHPLMELLRLPVELRQRTDAEPGRVPTGQRLVEVEEGVLRRALVRRGPLEPLMRDTAVVHRQVSDELHPARVRRPRK